MRQVRYLAQAQDDIISIRRYIASESGDADLARRFTNRIREQCRKLAESQGEIGRTRAESRPNLRSVPFGSYVIFFIYNDSFLDIITIIEGHRDIDALFDSRREY